MLRDAVSPATAARLSAKFDTAYPPLPPPMDGDDPRALDVRTRRYPPALIATDPFCTDFLEDATVLDTVEALLGPGFLFLSAAVVRFGSDTPCKNNPQSAICHGILFSHIVYCRLMADCGSFRALGWRDHLRRRGGRLPARQGVHVSRRPLRAGVGVAGYHPRQPRSPIPRCAASRPAHWRGHPNLRLVR